MIKANEFRIGNLFILPNGDIGKISYHEIRLMVVAIEKPDYQPIPLTEEWLLKFGFEWSIQHQAHYLNGFDFVIDICTDYSRVIKYKRGGEVMTRIQHVHQLQNLYFALTGEELTIKETKL